MTVPDPVTFTVDRTENPSAVLARAQSGRCSKAVVEGGTRRRGVRHRAGPPGTATRESSAAAHQMRDPWRSGFQRASGAGAISTRTSLSALKSLTVAWA